MAITSMAFTVKYNPKDLEPEGYKFFLDSLMDLWKSKGFQITKYIYEEFDNKGNHTQIHAHGVAEIPNMYLDEDIFKPRYCRRLIPKGFHVHIEYYLNGYWDQVYMVKNRRNRLRACGVPVVRMLPYY